MKKPWTEEDIAFLKAQRLLGVPFSKIGAHLNRTRHQCIGKAHRLNLPAALPNLPCVRSRYVLPPVHISVDERNPQALYLPLADLAYNQCRWPYGDDPFFFCAVDTSSYPYCEFHRKVAYRKPW